MKEEGGTLVECLMELVSMGDENRIMVHFGQSHPAAKGLLNKPFPYYDELTYVFGRNRATGRFAENSPTWGLTSLADGNEEFPPVYSQGIDLSQDDVRASRPSRTLEGRTRSSGSKRKRGSQREVDVEGIHLALDQTNEQLRMIAKWPVCGPCQ
uniref:Retrotransposon protein n=1 Tax=Cucumis melo TaxID=3656 RepID=A0A9I9EEI8_CUCME